MSGQHSDRTRHRQQVRRLQDRLEAANVEAQKIDRTLTNRRDTMLLRDHLRAALTLCQTLCVEANDLVAEENDWLAARRAEVQANVERLQRQS